MRGVSQLISIEVLNRFPSAQLYIFSLYRLELFAYPGSTGG